MAATPLVSSHPPVDAPVPGSSPLAITVLPVDPPLSADLVSPTDPAPPVNLLPPVTVTQEEAAKLRAKYTHFRILIIGRANAGKTTLLKRVCKTEEDPVYKKVSYQLRLISHSYPFFLPTD
jgi:Flp pilus assembly CpaF family ATPase